MCPSCEGSQLQSHQPRGDLEVDICDQCRGIFCDRGELNQLVGVAVALADLTKAAEIDLSAPSMRCPACGHAPMQEQVLKTDRRAQVWSCRPCGGTWFAEGAFPIVASAARAQQMATRKAAMDAAPKEENAPAPVSELAFSRSSFDEGLENLIALPVALLFGALVSTTKLGGLLAWLVAMPFHELGHAIASWLTSRFAIPLPFFTIWLNEQSVLFGGLVASGFAYLIFHSAREKRWFGVALGIALLLMQFVSSLFVSQWTTLRWQILGGCLGEIGLSALLLVAFYFPLPDRLRWDFWRWLFVIPAASCLWRAHALWQRASQDLSQMPWGSALGNESDGDMNRLVNDFGLEAQYVAGFYLNAVYMGLAAVALAYAYRAWQLWTRHQNRTPNTP